MPEDYQAQLDAMVADTRKNVAMPTDGCVIQSLAAQLFLARKRNAEMRKALGELVTSCTPQGKQLALLGVKAPKVEAVLNAQLILKS